MEQTILTVISVADFPSDFLPANPVSEFYRSLYQAAGQTGERTATQSELKKRKADPSD